MGAYEDLLKRAGRTASAPKYEESGAAVIPHPPSQQKVSLDQFMNRGKEPQGDMSAEEFFRRNPSARDVDGERRRKIEQAQFKARQRKTPPMRDTKRSQKQKQQQEQESWYDDSIPKIRPNSILGGAIQMVGKPRM